MKPVPSETIVSPRMEQIDMMACCIGPPNADTGNGSNEFSIFKVIGLLSGLTVTLSSWRENHCFGRRYLFARPL
jgi:hypothetical protein